MSRFLVILTSCVLFCSSCHIIGRHRIHGNGNIITSSRDVSDFNGVKVSGAINVYLSNDSGFSVKVETDENLQDFIEVYKEGGVLKIHQRNNTSLDPSGKIKVYVSAPVYYELNASGACKLISRNMISSDQSVRIRLSGASDADLELKSPAVSSSLTGASTLILRGETKDFSVDGSGSSDIKCFDLLTESTKIDVSGASSAEVFASVKLDVDASGASDIKYRGGASVNQHISGAGSVKKVD